MKARYGLHMKVLVSFRASVLVGKSPVVMHQKERTPSYMAGLSD